MGALLCCCSGCPNHGDEGRGEGDCCSSDGARRASTALYDIARGRIGLAKPSPATSSSSASGNDLRPPFSALNKRFPSSPKSPCTPNDDAQVLKEVERLVAAGADITYRPDEDAIPSFLLFVISGQPDCFAACMQTSRPIDFTEGYLKWRLGTTVGAGVGPPLSPCPTHVTSTPGPRIRDETENRFREGGALFRPAYISPSALVYLCSGRQPHEVKVFLKAVLRRRNPKDKMDWENAFQTDPARSFFCAACESGLLHAVWPFLKQVPLYAQRLRVGRSSAAVEPESAYPIPIHAAVTREDWEKLSPADREHFNPIEGFFEGSTVKLWRLCVNRPCPEAVRSFVQEGAQIQFRFISGLTPLDLLLMRSEVECVAACMETERCIHFSDYEKGNNLLVLTCMYVHPEKVLSGMLRVLIRRIAQHRSKDHIDWEFRDGYGHDFFSYAAEYDLLHVVWPLVKELPHFQNKQEPIVISRRVTSEDWDQLSTEDQRRFDPVEGFVGTQFRIRGDRVVVGPDGQRVIEQGAPLQWSKKGEIGRGVFGIVYLGQLMNGDQFAVKVANLTRQRRRSASTAAEKKNRKEKKRGVPSKRRDINVMLLDEMEIMKHLRHKHIVQFYGARNSLNEEDGCDQIEIFMEFCPSSLAVMLQRQPEHFTIAVVRSYAKQILEGLAYLDRNKIVHRDLKPQNVLLTADGVAKLTDFGCSKNLKRGETCKTLTGTPMFIAPEVLSAEHDNRYGSAADIWSLGCTVIALLGREPWDCPEQSDAQLLWKIAYSNELPSGIPKPCPKDLHDFLMHCFERDPSKRWTAEQLLQHRWMTCAESELVEVLPLLGDS